MPYTSRSEQNGTQHLCKPLALEVLFVLANVYSNAVALLPRTIWPSNASRACSNNWSAMLVGYAGLGYVSVVLRPRASAVQVPAITGDCYAESCLTVLERWHVHEPHRQPGNAGVRSRTKPY